MEIEFEVVREPKGQIPGLIGIKKQKPAKDRLVELCKCEVAQRWGETWQTAFEINIARLLLEIEAEEKASDGRVRMSEIYFCKWGSRNIEKMWAAKDSGKRYVCVEVKSPFNTVRDLDGEVVCSFKDVIDDMGGDNGK